MKCANGLPLTKGREDLDGQAEVGGDAGDVGFGAGRLQMEKVAGVDRLAGLGRHAQSHAGRHQQRVFAIGFERDVHTIMLFVFEPYFSICKNSNFLSLYQTPLQHGENLSVAQ